MKPRWGLSLFLALVVLYLLYLVRNQRSQPDLEKTKVRIIRNLFDTFRTHKPVPNQIVIHRKAETSRTYQGDKLTQLTSLRFNEIETTKQTHRAAVSHLLGFPAIHFDGQGVVIVGDGSFARVALHSMRMLRRSTNLPIELWVLNKREYDERDCTELSALSVRFRTLDEYLPDEVMATSQLKCFAMLLSSFEEVLLLDPDNFPIASVDDVFTAGQYSSNGVVIWQDSWASTASPWLYQIIERHQAFFGTCETGQLLWNKRTHFHALLLACYYNFYGPTYFYPLLSVGEAGQGDKETFLLACFVMNQSYSLMDTDIVTPGYHDEQGEFHGTGMIRADPRNTSRLLFFHARHPKMDARYVFDILVLCPWGKTGQMIKYWMAAILELRYIECDSLLARPECCSMIYRYIDSVSGSFCR